MSEYTVEIYGKKLVSNNLYVVVKDGLYKSSATDKLSAERLANILNSETASLRAELAAVQAENMHLQAKLDETITWNEDLQEENAQLRAALKPFALEWTPDFGGHRGRFWDKFYADNSLSAKHFRQAYNLLDHASEPVSDIQAIERAIEANEVISDEDFQAIKRDIHIDEMLLGITDPTDEQGSE